MGGQKQKEEGNNALSRSISISSDLNESESNDPRQYQVQKSRLIKLINWGHVISTYFPFLFLTIVAVLVAQFVQSIYMNKDNVQELARAISTTSNSILFDLGWKFAVLVIILIIYLARRSQQVYLVDYACFEPPPDWKATQKEILQMMKNQSCFTDSSLEFMEKILARSGTGEATAWPPGILKSLREGGKMDRSVEAARAEAELVIYNAVQNLMDKTGFNPKGIDVLIINCSLFSPTPSLCSMVIHKFGLRPSVLSYNLSGMGCSAGVISIDLAKRLMANQRNTTCLVISTENLTQNLYHGNEKSMLLQNTLFRCGGAAILLSNKLQDGFKAKFKLLCTVRTQGMGSEAYNAVFECEDSAGNHGVALSKEIVMVAGRTMEKNFTTLGPMVLPLSEQAKVVWALVLRSATKSLKRWLDSAGLPALSKMVVVAKTYIPDFKRGIDHFCIHAGGRAVIEGIEKNMKLNEALTEASKATLRDYGNTSSSSIWYELKYIEERCSLRRGQRVLQVAFGSGFKCNSCVWLSLKTNRNMKK